MIKSVKKKVRQFENPKGVWYAQILFEKTGGGEFSQFLKFRQEKAPTKSQVNESINRFTETYNQIQQQQALTTVEKTLPPLVLFKPTGIIARIALWLIGKLQRWVK